jgi:hypothetical protein
VESWRRDILEMDGKRQRGTDREEETERRGTGEQTEENRQGGEIKASRSPLTQLENIGSVYPFYVYDGNSHSLLY